MTQIKSPNSIKIDMDQLSEQLCIATRHHMPAVLIAGEAVASVSKIFADLDKAREWAKENEGFISLYEAWMQLCSEVSPPNYQILIRYIDYRSHPRFQEEFVTDGQAS